MLTNSSGAAEGIVFNTEPLEFINFFCLTQKQTLHIKYFMFPSILGQDDLISTKILHYNVKLIINKGLN